MDRLESGLSIPKEDWSELLSVPQPWGKAFYSSILEARDSGAPLLPQLLRMQKLIEEQTEWMFQAQAKVAPAQGQAVLAVLLVPTFALSLWFLLPDLQAYPLEFGAVVWAAGLMGLGAFFWMLEMSETARFGGLSVRQRPWMVAGVLVLERIQALVRIGHPPDLAWSQSVEELRTSYPHLVSVWSGTLWNDFKLNEKLQSGHSRSEALVLGLGSEIKRVVQTSLIEGHGAIDRLEALQRSWIADIRGEVEQQLAKLGNRSLQPLFMLVLPAVFLVMACGIGATVLQQGAP